MTSRTRARFNTAGLGSANWTVNQVQTHLDRTTCHLSLLPYVCHMEGPVPSLIGRRWLYMENGHAWGLRWWPRGGPDRSISEGHFTTNGHSSSPFLIYWQHCQPALAL